MAISWDSPTWTSLIRMSKPPVRRCEASTRPLHFGRRATACLFTSEHSNDCSQRNPRFNGASRAPDYPKNRMKSGNKIPTSQSSDKQLWRPSFEERAPLLFQSPRHLRLKPLSIFPAARPGPFLHLPPLGCPVPLPHSIALNGEDGDEDRGQRDGDDWEDGIAAHANVRPLVDRQTSFRSTTQLASK
jgi:hypothetical protein